MVRRTKDEAVETRNQILDAAERVFSARGVSRTSLADIAKAASVTRGAIYWHFKDKADLFCEMVARVTMPMEDAPCQIDPGREEDPLESIRAMLTGILQRTSGDAQARRVFHIVFNKCEYVDEMQQVWQRFREMQAGCLQRLELGLAAAVKRGQLPAGLDTRQTAAGLHALLNGLISKWVMDPDHVPSRTDAAGIIDVFLEGLRAAPAVPAGKPKRAAARRPRTRPAPAARRRA
ncbi:MAG: TetR family transcriptional regulator [Burkholderiales bacterium]|jgi:TetR/AcrR family acrAB operon transcriptional repressor|nr:TetR family transcriptional regulator [Burkholderiales bacterium]